MSTATASGLAVFSPRLDERLQRGEVTSDQVDQFVDFAAEVDRELMHHRVITDNIYTHWFSHGMACDDEFNHFVRQFSLLTRQFQSESKRAGVSIPSLACWDWLLEVAAGMGLTGAELARPDHARPYTLAACGQIERVFSAGEAVAQGAAFAVEHWAAGGFWHEVEDGLMRIQQLRRPQLSWHDHVEARHPEALLEELEAAFFSPGFDRARFLAGARESLDSLAVFWDGLEQDRNQGIYS